MLQDLSHGATECDLILHGQSHLSYPLAIQAFLPLNDIFVVRRVIYPRHDRFHFTFSAVWYYLLLADANDLDTGIYNSILYLSHLEHVALQRF